MSVLELVEITKRYPRVLANDHVSLRVEAGEIHAIVGENGAGKSTLMSILYGLTSPDSGAIVIDGRIQDFRSPADAIRAGLGMVFQEFQLFADLTVAENVVYGSEPHRAGVLDRRAASERIAGIADRYGLAVPVDRLVRELPVGVRQRVEILKSLYRGARILILDEPTAVLTPQEGEALFAVLRALAAAGTSVIFISHKLEEVRAIADRVTVLRDGRVTASDGADALSLKDIARSMTGREVQLVPRRAATPPGEAVLELRDVSVEEHGRLLLDAVSLTVRRGEIVGVAGVAGNGQDVLAATIAGHRRIRAGRLLIAGADVADRDATRRRELGLTHIPEDRRVEGSAPLGDAVLNLSAGYHRRPPLGRRGILHPAAMREHARRLIARFGIRIAAPTVAVGTLSGGNLQKVVVARELGHDAPLLVAEQPTRGVDLGAIESIHAELDSYRARGGAVLLISTELSEVLNLSDRVVVMSGGRIMADVPAEQADKERIGLLMAGIASETDAG